MSKVIHIRSKKKQKNKVENKTNKRNNKNNHSAGRYILIIAFGLAIMLFLVTRLFRIEHYEIEGNRLYSNDEIMEILKVEPNSNILNVYMNASRNLDEFPYLNSVNVDFKSYNKVKITVQEKQIIGYIFYLSEYLCIDKDGYIVDYVDSESLDEKIAILEGLFTETLVLGEKINLPKSIIDICLLFHKAELKYGLNIDTINFNGNSTSNISLIVNHVDIEFGNMTFFNEKIQSIKDILPQIPPEDTGTLYLGNDGSTSYFEKNLE
ncbi:MAG: hypothetical protein CVU84_02470 [Firmicutes bacterium HGW-Firmicutes-1]|jgi:hypothetical protein|nr:MAG: hypothetical protein CVU84_02470 [Firmicutes bacterium HGW-Firmicutes-1]